MEWRRVGRLDPFPEAPEIPEMGIELCVSESRDEAELDTFLLLKKSFWKNFFGLNEENMLLGFGGFIAFVCKLLRSFSASAMRCFKLSRSPFKLEKSWCRESQPSPPVPSDGTTSLLPSGRLTSSPDSGANSARMLLGMSLMRKPPLAAVRTCSKNNTCAHFYTFETPKMEGCKLWS
jgi:hypothetical protein